MSDEVAQDAGPEPSGGPDEARPAGSTWSFLLRGLGAALLTYVFMVLLMTVIAQSAVVARLSSLSPVATYSAGYERAVQIQNRLHEAWLWRADADRRALDGDDRESARQRLGVRVETLRGRILPIYRQMAAFCGFGDASPGAAEYIWQDLAACARRPDYPQAERLRFQAILDDGSNPQAIFANYRQAIAEAQETQRRATNLRSAADRQAKLSEADTQIRAAFAELGDLRYNPWLGGGFLIQFPPALLQLPLAFVSGMFGALLLTLVLVVYPNSGFTATAARNLGSRILLGGLIALCVYVVLLGGAAILGTAATLARDSTNYMTFCGLSILAGMFSDRVASWLSDRANVFFKRGNDPSARG